MFYQIKKKTRSWDWRFSLKLDNTCPKSYQVLGSYQKQESRTDPGSHQAVLKTQIVTVKTSKNWFKYVTMVLKQIQRSAQHLS